MLDADLLHMGLRVTERVLNCSVKGLMKVDEQCHCSCKLVLEVHT